VLFRDRVDHALSRQARHDRSVAESLIRNADAALDKAKAIGRNCAAVFNEKFEQETRYRFGIESGLRRAIEGGELRVHYQPIVAVSRGQTV
jgi:predicted signal transduction protein with EAL and GGDEF domain